MESMCASKEKFSFSKCTNKKQKERQQFDLIASRINVLCTVQQRVKHGRKGADADMLVRKNTDINVHIEGSHLKERTSYRKPQDVQHAFTDALHAYAPDIDVEDFVQLWIQFGGKMTRETQGILVDSGYKVLHIPRTTDHFTPADYDALDAFLVKYHLRQRPFNRVCREVRSGRVEWCRSISEAIDDDFYSYISPYSSIDDVNSDIYSQLHAQLFGEAL